MNFRDAINFFSFHDRYGDIGEHNKTPSSTINGPMSWKFSDCVFDIPIENEWEAAPIKFSPTLFF